MSEKHKFEHNSLFGWLNLFRLGSSSILIMKPLVECQPSYPVMISKPTFSQVISNWNMADTGIVITFALFGLLHAKWSVSRADMFDSIIERRTDFNILHNYWISMGIFLGLRNSAYRLQGHVPNGLPRRKTYEPMKYNYSGMVINNTFWKYFFDLNYESTFPKQ